MGHALRCGGTVRANVLSQCLDEELFMEAMLEEGLMVDSKNIMVDGKEIPDKLIDALADFGHT